MEIERKWLVKDWPAALPLLYEERQRQGYLHTTPPVVRIRKEARTGSFVRYVLCVKSAGTLAREEIELEIAPEQFDRLEQVIGLPLIEKVRRAYRLPDGALLEVNLVDAGCPCELMYAEVEFPSVEKALSWSAENVGLKDYLALEVTQENGQSMAAHWARTRTQAAVSSKA